MDSTPNVVYNSAVSAVRLRRGFEPKQKTWDDSAVSVPFEEVEALSTPSSLFSRLVNLILPLDGSTPTMRTVSLDALLSRLRYSGREITAMTTFVLKNVFFFSHATRVQELVIPRLRGEGMLRSSLQCPRKGMAEPSVVLQGSSSMMAEAATGSGKTLAFLVPLVERLTFAAHSFLARGVVIEHLRQRWKDAGGCPPTGVSATVEGMACLNSSCWNDVLLRLPTGPPLGRDIVAVVVSPTSSLAEQTYVVLKKLLARQYHLAPSAVLLDGFVNCVSEANTISVQAGDRGGDESAGLASKGRSIEEQLRRAKRGCGTILVTTPSELQKLMNSLLPPQSGGGGAQTNKEKNREGFLSVDGILLSSQERTSIPRFFPPVAAPLFIPQARPTTNATEEMATSKLAADLDKFLLSRERSVSRNGVTEEGDKSLLSLLRLQRLPFMLIIDEGDAVLEKESNRAIMEEFLNRLRGSEETCSQQQQQSAPPRGVKRARGGKTGKVGQEPLSSCPWNNGPMSIDIGIFGATVTRSEHAGRFVQLCVGAASSSPPNVFQPVRVLHSVQLHRGKSHLSATIVAGGANMNSNSMQAAEPISLIESDAYYFNQVRNRFIVVNPCTHYLETLIHLINAHPNKKHFVFFTDHSALEFVRCVLERVKAEREGLHVPGTGAGKGAFGGRAALLEQQRKSRQQSAAGTLAGAKSSSPSAHPLLYVGAIYAVHYKQTESQRFAQLSAFLSHVCGEASGAVADASAAATDSFTRATGLVAHKRDRLLRAELKQRRGEIKKGGGDVSTADFEGGVVSQKRGVFQSGLKRVGGGDVKAGTGAILLCAGENVTFGIDIRDVDYCYHFGIDMSNGDAVARFVHRIGRVGRMGMSGMSVILVPAKETISESLAGSLANKRLPARGCQDQDTVGIFSGSKELRHMVLNKIRAKPAGRQYASANDSDEKEQDRDGGKALEHLQPMLTDAATNFLVHLHKIKPLEEYSLSSACAPITATLRSVVQAELESPTTARLGKLAAMNMAGFTGDVKKTNESWFTPKMATSALLL